MACGSGAFLVQVCIYLSHRLLEAWEEAEKRVHGSPRITPYGEVSTGLPDEQLIPLDRQERLIYARRLVAERCVYGVDKNLLAVEMAKLSLWLLTLAKDKPFTFLDHAIRCGDSLVGLSSIDQLLRFSLTENAKVRPLMEQQRQQIEKRLQATMLLRKQIEAQPSNTPQDIERKTKMLENVEDQTKRHITYAADMLLAATWGAETETDSETALNSVLAEVEYKFKDLHAGELEAEGKNTLQKAGIKGRFHWPLEFPEVFLQRAGFDAFVCNPPFMGGQKIAGALSKQYRSFIMQIVGLGRKGSADLCSYFVLRSCSMLRESGGSGLISTNTISEGETRQVGLEQLDRLGCTLRSALTTIRWPGTASLVVSILWLQKGTWVGEQLLDGVSVSGISSALAPQTGSSRKPYRLMSNKSMAFKGCSIQGIGFLLSPHEAERIIAQDANYSQVLFPYLGGADITSTPNGAPSRWAINFFDWPLSIAEQFPICLEIVRTQVKPQRELASDRNTIGARRAEFWWRYDAQARPLYDAIKSMESVWVLAQTSKYCALSRQRTDIMFDQKAVVFANNSFRFFAMLSSNFHLAWVRHYGGSLKTDISYSVSDVFETFPFPGGIIQDPENTLFHCGSLSLTELEVVGRQFFEFRQQTLIEGDIGLTSVYNKIHNPKEDSPTIQ